MEADFVGRFLDHFLLGPRIGLGGEGGVHVALDGRLCRIPESYVRDLRRNSENEEGCRLAWESLVNHIEGQGKESIRLVAVKIRKASMGDRRDADSSGAAPLALEWSSLVRLGAHPHIVSVLDAGMMTPKGDDFRSLGVREEAPGSVAFLVMPYHGEGSLGGDGGRLATMSALERLEACRDAALAVEYMHENDIVHRDIKPDNMLIVADGYVQICDFGFSLGASAPSLEGGTVGYLAPERAVGLGHQGSGVASALNDAERNKRVDVFALGVSCFTILLGRHLFAKANDGRDDLIDMTVNGRAAANARALCSLTKSGLPTEAGSRLREKLLQSVANHPEDRCSAADLREALDSSIADVRMTQVYDTDSNPIQRARMAVTAKAARGLADLIAVEGMRPTVMENENVYCFFFVRQPMPSVGGVDRLNVVYVAHYNRSGDGPVGSIDWALDHTGYRRSPIVTKCCSGLCIELISSNAFEEWERDGVIAPGKMEVYKSERLPGKVSCVFLNRVGKSRAGMGDAYCEFLRSRYVGGYLESSKRRGPSFRFSPKVGSERYAMAETQTECVIPIYRPGAKQKRADTIVAVVNVEWVAELGEDRRKSIADAIDVFVHGDCSIPVSDFLCEIVDHLAPKSGKSGRQRR